MHDSFPDVYPSNPTCLNNWPDCTHSDAAQVQVKSRLATGFKGTAGRIGQDRGQIGCFVGSGAEDAGEGRGLSFSVESSAATIRPTARLGNVSAGLCGVEAAYLPSDAVIIITITHGRGLNQGKVKHVNQLLLAVTIEYLVKV